LEDFSRDAHPDDELAVWERMAKAFQLFISQGPTVDHATRKDIFAVLLAASMGAEDWSKIKHLSRDQINHVVLLYRGL
jgi:hypothetical protein